MAQYGSEAVSLFNNMRTPASILASAIIPLGLTDLPTTNNGKDDSKIPAILRRVFPLVAISSLTNHIIALVWATIAVNDLTTSSSDQSASSLWELLQRDYELPWVATNVHFILGMLGFMWITGARIYLKETEGPIGRSVAGLAISGMFHLISIINRGIQASASDNSHPFGRNIFGLIRQYAGLLSERTTSKKRLGLFEVLSGIFLGIAALNAIITIRGETRDLSIVPPEK